MNFTIKGYSVQVDECDADLIRDHKWQVYQHGQTFYVSRTLPRGSKPMTQHLHRVILARILGRELQKGEFCDHVNGNACDNRRSNLRPCSHSENIRNSRKPMTNTSGLKGVTFHKASNKWLTQIGIDGKRIHLGTFATREEAYAAYCEAAIRLFGEFARFE